MSVGAANQTQEVLREFQLHTIDPNSEESQQVFAIASAMAELRTASKQAKELQERTMDDVKVLREKAERLEKALEAAKNYINKSPCDPDITQDQAQAWREYQEALKEV